jgi:hypothetical protein
VEGEDGRASQQKKTLYLGGYQSSSKTPKFFAAQRKEIGP